MMLAEHKKNPVPMLDHWRDKREAMQKAVLALQSLLPTRQVLEEVALAAQD